MLFLGAGGAPWKIAEILIDVLAFLSSNGNGRTPAYWTNKKCRSSVQAVASYAALWARHAIFLPDVRNLPPPRGGGRLRDVPKEAVSQLSHS